MPAEFELVPPAYRTELSYAATLGPEVADLVEAVGLIPDPEQRLALDMMFAVDKRGKSAVFEFAVICARQNLKTGLFKMAAMGWLFLTAVELTVWSAHEFQTTREAHRDMVALIDSSAWFSRKVKAIYDSSNDKSIHLLNGSRLIFKARTQSGGRGLSGDKVILDEAFALQAGHVASLLPTVSAKPDPQIAYASSAGMARSTVLRAIRDRGRSDRPGRLGYLEWCAPPGGCAIDGCEHALHTPGCALDKLENRRAANPLLGRVRANGTTLSEEYLDDERQAFAAIPMEWARERLGWWDDPGAAEVFGAGRWEACGGRTPERARLLAVAVAVSVNLDAAAVVGVGVVGARVYVQVLAHGPGWDWLPERVPGDVKCLVDPRGPAAVAVPALKQALRKRLVEPTRAQVYDAFDAMLTLVKEGDLLHDRDSILTASANGAVPRLVGDRSTWGRRTSTADTTAIEAATLAAWWASLPAATPPPPPPAAVVAAAPTARGDDLTTMGF